MSVYEVGRILQPSANLVHALSADPEEKRLTFQHFDTHNLVVMTMAPHNCDARLSNGADWPLDVIFDAAYGIAALKAWGTPTFREFLWNYTRAMYHDNEDTGGDENGGGDDTIRVTGIGTGQRKEMVVGKRVMPNSPLTFTTCFWGYGCSMPGRVSVRPML